MKKILNFEDFINENSLDERTLGTELSNVIVTVGDGPEGELIPDDNKVYVRADENGVNVSKYFRTKDLKVSLNFNDDNMATTDKMGNSVKGGITSYIASPKMGRFGDNVFICKSAPECASMCYKVLVEMISALESTTDYKLITDLVKSFVSILKDSEGKTLTNDVSSFKAFVSGLKNIYDVAGVQKSLGDLGAVENIDHQQLLSSVKAGLA